MKKIGFLKQCCFFCAFVFFSSSLVASLLACKAKAPVIKAIDPKIGVMGDIISIAGEHFGKERDASYITIAGQEPTASSYFEWTDNLIRVRLPEFGRTGLIYIHKGDLKSNAVLFSNRSKIPEHPQSAPASAGPRIDTVKPGSASIGALISVQGGGFGAMREDRSVRFSWTAENPFLNAENSGKNTIEPFDAGLGYELWTSNEIRLRVPDGAVSGAIEIHTAQGNSAPVFFTVDEKPGVKAFHDKRSWVIAYSVNIQVQDSSTPNTLYLWLPQPAYSSSQPNIALLFCDKEPFVENYRGTTLFQIKDAAAQSNISINVSYVVDVYAVETAVKPQSIKTQSAFLPASYTQNDPLIPSDDPAVTAYAAEIVGRERNPYIKAQKIYEWVIANNAIQNHPLNNNALDVLEQKQADSYSASLLFCALARSAGIPAIPVAGVLIDKNRIAHVHYWAEFWIDGFGWVPLDPALGARAAPAFFSLRDDAESWYFGNIDNQRVSFSRGQNRLSQMDPRGRLAAHKPDYALQDFWEEAVGGITSYSSLWSDIAITGMYTQ
ncbi:MAG: IPT/TIG domain-containing protein [Treponema sp.]|jgi:transglutaminase-like putative cysteine protease|nr:IPT/TIG domain-containing protein [Treponema sp.]